MFAILMFVIPMFVTGLSEPMKAKIETVHLMRMYKTGNLTNPFPVLFLHHKRTFPAVLIQHDVTKFECR